MTTSITTAGNLTPIGVTPAPNELDDLQAGDIDDLQAGDIDDLQAGDIDDLQAGDIDDLRMENAELRRQLDDFRAGYIRQTDRLLIALDALRQVAHERKETLPCSN